MKSKTKMGNFWVLSKKKNPARVSCTEINTCVSDHAGCYPNRYFSTQTLTQKRHIVTALKK